LRLFGAPPLRVVLWDGEEVGAPAGTARFTLRLRDRGTLWKVLANPDLGFGDAYSDGRLEVEGDFLAFLETMYRLEEEQRGLLARLWGRLNRLQGSTLARARSNIHHHYDIGNDFYRLWLDEQLVYTCAYFPSPAASLEEAQVAKMDHVCRKLHLRPGQKVIEAGCGWGALALHMARRFGVRVRAFNISHEQVAHARERARAEGLERQVEFVEDDYRNITGTCDAFVSVGMLEHVGPRHYRQLGRVIQRCLAPAGLGLIHSLGRNSPRPMNAWLGRRIFPGAYIPALREMMEVLEPYEFSILDVENLRLHYARTVEHWLHRFEQVADRVAGMFDARFVRMWRLYLAGSLAGFTTGLIQLFQIVFAPGASHAVPWTRAHVYAND
jgi:cyclopropane-fatty-acyl-phospholipid synthase